jgi:phage terminase large subunit-like protein
MMTWTPDDGTSPDRLDALVWALTDLMLGGPRGAAAF